MTNYHAILLMCDLGMHSTSSSENGFVSTSMKASCASSWFVHLLHLLLDSLIPQICNTCLCQPIRHLSYGYISKSKQDRHRLVTSPSPAKSSSPSPLTQSQVQVHLQLGSKLLNYKFRLSITNKLNTSGQ